MLLLIERRVSVLRARDTSALVSSPLGLQSRVAVSPDTQRNDGFLNEQPIGYVTKLSPHLAASDSSGSPYIEPFCASTGYESCIPSRVLA